MAAHRVGVQEQQLVEHLEKPCAVDHRVMDLGKNVAARFRFDNHPTKSRLAGEVEGGPVGGPGRGQRAAAPFDRGRPPGLGHPVQAASAVGADHTRQQRVPPRRLRPGQLQLVVIELPGERQPAEHPTGVRLPVIVQEVLLEQGEGQAGHDSVERNQAQRGLAAKRGL